jgi:hypothetical protein
LTQNIFDVVSYNNLLRYQPNQVNNITIFRRIITFSCIKKFGFKELHVFQGLVSYKSDGEIIGYIAASISPIPPVHRIGTDSTAG